MVCLGLAFLSLDEGRAFKLSLNRAIKKALLVETALFCGGSERIRTAVKGFADLCLATRPRNPFQGGKDREIAGLRNHLICF